MQQQGITGRNGGVIDHVEFFSDAEAPDANSRNFVLCPGGAYDRSPCGTGTSAKLACLADDGVLAPDTDWVQESVIGSRFVARYSINAQNEIIPSITGRAFICAETTLDSATGRPVRRRHKCMTDSVIIVGGGHIGIACAHYLQQDGHDVTVIDQGEIGGGCSRGNCGFIVPSHVLPLTTPDALLEGIRSLFQPRAPFRVKPQLRGALMRWMWEFGRRCTHDSMMAASRSLHGLLEASASEYHALLRSPELQCGWQDNGLLFVLRGEEALESFARKDALLSSEYGVSARLIRGSELQDFEPALLDDLAGAYLYEVRQLPSAGQVELVLDRTAREPRRQIH